MKNKILFSIFGLFLLILFPLQGITDPVAFTTDNFFLTSSEEATIQFTEGEMHFHADTTTVEPLNDFNEWSTARIKINFPKDEDVTVRVSFDNFVNTGPRYARFDMGFTWNDSNQEYGLSNAWITRSSLPLYGINSYSSWTTYQGEIQNSDQLATTDVSGTFIIEKIGNNITLSVDGNQNAVWTYQDIVFEDFYFYIQATAYYDNDDEVFTPSDGTTLDVDIVAIDIQRSGGSSSLSPIAVAGPDMISYGEVTLDGSQSSDSDGTIISHDWDLKYRGDSTYDTYESGTTPTILDLFPGFYDVTLTVTDDAGLTGTDTMLLAVAEKVQEECDAKDQTIAAMQTTIDSLNQTIAQNTTTITDLNEQIAEKNQTITAMLSTIDSMFTQEDVDTIVAETCPGNSENHGPKDKKK